MKRIDFLSPLSITISLVLIYLIFPLYGLFFENYSYLNIYKYEYWKEGLIITLIFVFIMILTLVFTNFYFTKKFNKKNNNPIIISKSKLLKISFIFFLLSFILQWILLKYTGMSFEYAFSHSLEYRFVLTKHTNGILFLLYYTPIIINAIIYAYYAFYRDIIRFSIYEKNFFRLVFIMGIIYSILSGSRYNLIVFVIIYLLSINKTKRINFVKLFSVFIVLLVIIGFLGAYRFGLDIEQSFNLIKKMIIIRFDAFIPGAVQFVNLFLQHDQQIYYGWFYVSLPLVFLPRSIFPQKPEILENFLNNYALVSDNTGRNFSALAEFMINFNFFGLLIHIFISIVVFYTILKIYYKFSFSPYYFTLYSFFIFLPFGLIFVSGVGVYTIIKIPYIFLIVLIFEKTLKLKI